MVWPRLLRKAYCTVSYCFVYCHNYLVQCVLPLTDEQAIRALPLTDETCISETDKAAIVYELGYFPNNVMCVKAYHGNTPAVLQLYPLKDGRNAVRRKKRGRFQPMPTIYWLCCKELKERISYFEERGYIKTFYDRLQKDPVALATFHKNHVDYCNDRWALLSNGDRIIVEEQTWCAVLRESGIAGIQQFDGIKCLHAHYGHYLATKNNIIGEWVHELLA